MQRRRLLLGSAIAGLLLSACATAPDSSMSATPVVSDEPVVYITSADLPEVLAIAGEPGPAAPLRIVSLATGVGETLAALGVADRVVGRDETSDVPGIAAAPIVTAAHSVSAERVLALNPDLVLIDSATAPVEALEQIARSGVEVVSVPEAWTLTDMDARISAVAAAVDVDPTTLLATVGELSAATTPPDAPTVAFLYLRGTSGIYLLGGQGSGADALITAAGGIDVGASEGFDPFVPLTAEALVELNPDVLLVMTKGLDSVNGIDGLLDLPGVAQTSAGESGRVIVVDDEVLLSFGPRTPALVEQLRAALVTVTG